MRALALGFLIALLTVPACKKSVEGESKRWTTANKTVDELSVIYPGFKQALEQQRQQARAAMDAAEQIADQEERIRKMAAANDLITAGFVGQLRDVDRKVKRIREKIIEAPAKATDEADRMSASRAAEQAQRMLNEVDVTLRRGVQDAAAASVMLRKMTEDLRAAEGFLDKVARTADDKKRAKEAPAAGKAADQAPGQAQEPAAWTCEYCGHSNAADARTCSNCGAAHP